MNNHKAQYGIPIAIIIVGMLIAGTVYWSGKENAVVSNNAYANSELRMIEESDHIRGNRSGAITIIEFSDFECPFCARLHTTLSRIVEEQDDVAWVYRHFPLSNVHTSALSSAVASECVALLGGNDDFWSFADNAFLNYRSLDNKFYQEIVTELNIDLSDFSQCQTDRSVVNAIQDDLNEVVGLGGRGTPFVVVVAKSGRFIPFSGALSYQQISAIVEQARNN